MKKTFVLILTAILAFSCCGCGPSKSKIVTNMISSLPTTITLDSESAIVAAEEAYAELSDKQKLEVEGYGKLLDARVTLDTIKIEESLKGEWVYTSYEPVNDGRCSTCNYFGYVRFNSTSRWLVLKDNYVVSVYDTHDDFHYSDHYRSGGNSGRWEYVNGTLTITFGNAAQVYTVSDGKLIWQNINEEVYTKCE